MTVYRVLSRTVLISGQWSVARKTAILLTTDHWPLLSLSRHQLFHVLRSRRQRPAQFDQLPVRIHVVVVFDAHSEILFWNINSRLDGEGLPRSQRRVVISGVVYVQPNGMAQSVDEILP